MTERDLTEWLAEWPYDPESVSARRVKGADGRVRIQLRVELGILQMEEEGRPDGQRPHGYGSLLEYLQTMERTSPAATRTSLDDEACAALQLEAVQYYHRYLAFSALGHLAGVVADCAHNLALIELVLRKSPDRPAAEALIQLYPFVRMMHARAKAELLMDGAGAEAAMEAVEEALHDIGALAQRHGLAESPRRMREIESLSEMLVSLRSRETDGAETRLRREMDKAVAAEDYERAAELRDRLRAVGEG